VDGNRSEEEKEQIRGILVSTFNEVNRIYNNWNKESEVSKINNSSANVDTPITKEVRKCH
jgi:thiamine biosynthesis lipoprotein